MKYFLLILILTFDSFASASNRPQKPLLNLRNRPASTRPQTQETFDPFQNRFRRRALDRIAWSSHNQTTFEKAIFGVVLLGYLMFLIARFFV